MRASRCVRVDACESKTAAARRRCDVCRVNRAAAPRDGRAGLRPTARRPDRSNAPTLRALERAHSGRPDGVVPVPRRRPRRDSGPSSRRRIGPAASIRRRIPARRPPSRCPVRAVLPLPTPAAPTARSQPPSDTLPAQSGPIATSLRTRAMPTIAPAAPQAAPNRAECSSRPPEGPGGATGTGTGGPAAASGAGIKMSPAHAVYLLLTYFSRRIWRTSRPHSLSASKQASTMFGLPHR